MCLAPLWRGACFSSTGRDSAHYRRQAALSVLVPVRVGTRQKLGQLQTCGGTNLSGKS